jgi:competence protein ComEC
MPSRSTVRPTLASLALAALLAACTPPPSRRPAPVPPVFSQDAAHVMRIHVIDVGQGDATLIEFPCGAALIDTGGEKNELFDGQRALKSYLEAFFARRKDLDRTLDLLVITHPHLDHVAGISSVLLAPGHPYRIKNVLTNGQESSPGGPEQQRLHEWVKAHAGVGYREIVADKIPEKIGLTDDVIDPFRCPGVDPRVVALWGRVTEDPGWGGNKWGKYFDNENNHSIVLRVEFGRASFLSIADMEAQAQRGLMERNRGSRTLRADVYRAGHHGSHNGTRLDFMRRVRPKVVLLSFGPASRRTEWTAWQYGHPRKDAIDILLKSASLPREPAAVEVGTGMHSFESLQIDRAVYGTGWDGSVIVEATDRGELRVFTTGGN